jgi:hypothetical protein
MCVTTKRKNGYEYLRKALDQARAQNATDEELIATLVRVAKSSPEGMEGLLAAYRETVRTNRADLSAAIEKALFAPQGAAKPVSVDSPVTKSSDRKPNIHVGPGGTR